MGPSNHVLDGGSGSPIAATCVSSITVLKSNKNNIHCGFEHFTDTKHAQILHYIISNICTSNCIQPVKGCNSSAVYNPSKVDIHLNALNIISTLCVVGVHHTCTSVGLAYVSM